jgi:hypothetical protein
MPNPKGSVRIETYIWKYPEFHGLVTPDAGAKLPTPADVLRYRDTVPEGFRFSIAVRR